MSLVLTFTRRTLFARPTLSVLTVLLLAISTSVLYGLYASISILGSVRTSLIKELAIEIELSDPSDSLRSALEDQLRSRSDVLQVQSLSANDVLQEMEQELGESLSDALTGNPFPPILRVKLREPSPLTSETFIREVSDWPGILRIVYPQKLWRKFDLWVESLKGRTGYFAALFALAGWVLSGLALRAIFRNRLANWHLLLLLGFRPRDLDLIVLFVEILLGAVAGLLAAALVQGAFWVAAWLFALPLPLPPGAAIYCVLVAIALSILGGIWAPRPARDA